MSDVDAPGRALVDVSTEGLREERTQATALEVSIVMPCLNEADAVGACVEKAHQALREMNVRGEVIVADNGSTDGSQDIARALGARVVHVESRGYGSALSGGILAARGTYVVMGDADDTYDFRSLALFVEKLREGYDLVMGNRFAGRISRGAMPALHRYVGNPIITWIGRRFFHSPVGDFFCGLRAFRREAIRTLDLRTTGMEFAIEMVVKATLRGLRITEVPTTLVPGRRNGRSHLRAWRDGWRALHFLLLYSPKWLFLYPGLVLMALGLAAGSWLLPAQRHVGHVTLDGQTLLFAAMAIVIGFQAVLFWLFSKVYAISEGLLPEDPRMERIFRFVRLEFGLLVGAILVLIGIGCSIYAFVRWERTYFGPLKLSSSLRIVIPALTALVLGCQTILSSFFLSVLGMKRP
jgi:glycosyltransferase involved in cell wall biosynthesis